MDNNAVLSRLRAVVRSRISGVMIVSLIGSLSIVVVMMVIEVRLLNVRHGVVPTMNEFVVGRGG